MNHIFDMSRHICCRVIYTTVNKIYDLFLRTSDKQSNQTTRLFSWKWLRKTTRVTANQQQCTLVQNEFPEISTNTPFLQFEDSLYEYETFSSS